MPSIRQYFLRHVAQTSEFPLMLEVDHAKGIYIFDRDGKAYIDMISGIGVSGLGHRHPMVVNAIHDQVNHYLHTMVYGEHIQAPQVQLAKTLAKKLPDSLDSVYFVNSGSEAVEGALKLAKKYTGRYEIICAENAYHGSTHAALALMDNDYFNQAFRPLVPGISNIGWNRLEDLEFDFNSPCSCNY